MAPRHRAATLDSGAAACGIRGTFAGEGKIANRRCEVELEPEPEPEPVAVAAVAAERSSGDDDVATEVELEPVDVDVDVDVAAVAVKVKVRRRRRLGGYSAMAVYSLPYNLRTTTTTVSAAKKASSAASDPCEVSRPGPPSMAVCAQQHHWLATRGVGEPELVLDGGTQVRAFVCVSA